MSKSCLALLVRSNCYLARVTHLATFRCLWSDGRSVFDWTRLASSSGGRYLSTVHCVSDGRHLYSLSSRTHVRQKSSASEEKKVSGIPSSQIKQPDIYPDVRIKAKLADKFISSPEGQDEDMQEGSDGPEDKVKGKKVKQGSVTLRSNIAQHDLEVKMKQVNDWLRKGQRAKVMVVKASGSSGRQKGLNTSLFDSVVKATQELGVVNLSKKTDDLLIIHITSKTSGASAANDETAETTLKSNKIPKPYTAKELQKLKSDGESKTGQSTGEVEPPPTH